MKYINFCFKNIFISLIFKRDYSTFGLKKSTREIIISRKEDGGRKMRVVVWLRFQKFPERLEDRFTQRIKVVPALESEDIGQ